MTSHYVRVSRNFVNLGKLYSVPPWGSVAPFGLKQPQRNGVNLGSLYTYPKHKRPPGWAYFDDGSVFIVPYGWLSHQAFETRMAIAAHFVNDPSPKLRAIRQTDPHKKRLVLINKDGREMKHNTFHILARNAQDGQRVSVIGSSFEDIALDLDSTGRYPTSARFKDSPQPTFEHRMRNREALETFRGTLVDGTLQPNVRLGNGLRLSNKPDLLKPQLQEKTRARNFEEAGGLPVRAPAKLMDRLRMRSSQDRPPPRRLENPTSVHDHGLEPREVLRPRRGGTSPPRERSSYMRTDRVPIPALKQPSAELDAKAAEIEAKERELEQREEILRWKHKAWILEQKLARATGGFPAAHELHQSDANAPRHNSLSSYKHSSDLEPAPDPQPGNAGGEPPFNNFNLDDTSPPEALANLRSRIQLPTKGRLHSKRMSRPR